MLISITQIFESMKKSGGGLHTLGIRLLLVNMLFSGCIFAMVAYLGEWAEEVDYFDFFIELANVLIAFLIFCLMALVRLKRTFKFLMTSGLLLMQTGLFIDFLDELIRVPIAHWAIIGDLFYLIGSLLLAYGTINWIVFSYRTSTLDKLTGVHNRRYFESMLKQYLSRLERHPEKATLLVLDLDDFKLINDDFGHACGDQVLMMAAEVLRTHARKADFVCRSGGEEFEMLLPAADTDEARKVAERILAQFHTSTPAPVPPLSASIGITAINRGDTIDSIRHRADQGMYSAKRDGKGRICVV